MSHNAWLSDLYLAHRRLLLLVAWNVTGNRDTAEDIVHAAVVRLAQLPASPTEPKSFALKVVRNLAVDHMRTIQSRRETSLLGDPNQLAIAKWDSKDGELAEAMAAALESLDFESREAVRLHLHGELTFREIGELVGKPLQTIASRYRRAIDSLREMLEAHHEPE